MINQFRKEKETLSAALNYFIRVSLEGEVKKEMHIPADCNDYMMKSLKKELAEALNKNKEIDLAKKVVSAFNLKYGMTKEERKAVKAQILAKCQYVTYDYQPIWRKKATGKTKEAGATFVYKKICWADAMELMIEKIWHDTYETPERKEPTTFRDGLIIGDYDK